MHTEANVTVRLGEIEKLIEAGSMSLGLRVINGGRTAVCSTSDLSPQSLERFAAETVDLASISERDEFAGLPEEHLLAKNVSASSLALYDERIESLGTDEKIQMAKACEGAAFSADPRVTNSDGASFSTRVGQFALANSLGFAGSYPFTTASLMVEAIADDAEGKKRNGHWFTAETSLGRLMDPEEVGRIAARRAVDQIGARKVPTTQAPVIFEPDIAVSLMRSLVGCASGDSLYRGSTFLASRKGETIGSNLVTIVDDPTLPGRFGSEPFDGEGVTTSRKLVFDAGRFEGFLFDCYTGRRTGNPTTGNAQRGVESLPSPGASNLIWQAGELSPEAIISGVSSGLYVTSLMGSGFNPTTGDYSRGAGGFWIENGRIAFPVTEINISGRMDEMMANVDAVGEDLTWFGASAAPTVRISRMTISGT
jgi:PmbA protein